MSVEDNSARIWARLDELREMLTRLLAVVDEREKNCARNEACINMLKERVRQLEINQAKVLGAATLLSVIIGHILKGLGW